jgi:leucyl-tRNA synthetase
MALTFAEIEKKWQQIWKDSNYHKANLNDADKKCYTLVMFSYPSSAKLHVGHWFNYAPTDTWSRYRKMLGYNVFQPMGFDSFGLPAENYAIKTNIHPKDTTETNIADIRGQIQRIGAMYDWDHEVVTSQPAYFKWTQWLFIQLFKNAMAYRSEAPVNWCPSCQTVLANEQVSDGLCERCDSEVARQNKVQWFFRITDFADALLNGLDQLDWPEKTKAMQRNWIGRSEGARVRFKVAGSAAEFDVFTTRPDTLWGVTYMVLAPEHSLVDQVTTPEQQSAVASYQTETSKLTDTERLSTIKEKTGVFTGAYAINPVNGDKVPIWIGDYVLSTYGYGAVMAVPGHDQRDYEFATRFELPIRTVIESAEMPEGEAYSGDGTMLNSGAFSGRHNREAMADLFAYLSANGFGEAMINYRLRDWSISRQRYWGAPIPIIYCDKCGAVPVPEEDLPVELPYDVDFKPTGESPLGTHEDFLHTTCPQCDGPATREVDTMDTFVDSSWYFLRYLDPKNDKEPFAADIVNRWLPIDKYVGGAEHAVMHLLYFRYITKALHKLGYLEADEPARSLIHQGVILGPDGNRMSKSRGNVINPDDFVKDFGADVFRGYLMFGFSYIEGGPWSDSGIQSIDRFYKRIFRFVEKYKWVFEGEQSPVEMENAAAELIRIMHNSIKGVTEDTERFQFNTSLARMMEFVNGLYKYIENRDVKAINAVLLKQAITNLLLLMAPYAPHLSQELWSLLFGDKSMVHDQEWPKYDEAVLMAEKVTVVLQINGKIRDKMEIEKDASKEVLQEKGMAFGRIPELLEGKKIIKVIAVPNKLLNIVIGK